MQVAYGPQSLQFEENLPRASPLALIHQDLKRQIPLLGHLLNLLPIQQLTILVQYLQDDI
jgi:hypothetical protein